MTDEELEAITNLQVDVNKILYDFISKGYKQVATEYGHDIATGVIVSALSTNLGYILAQVPDQQRDSYIDISSDIIEKSLQTAIESFASKDYGQIGHA